MAETWQDYMRVGIDQIDDDHRTLFEILDELDRDLRADDHPDHARLTGYLSRVQSYASGHFAREEAMQCEAGYPGLDENRRQHCELLRTLETFIVHFQSDLPKDPRLAARTMRSFLAVWIGEHIVKTDAKMRGRILPWSG